MYFTVEQVVVCKLTPLQIELYKLFVKSNSIDDMEDKSTGDGKLPNTALSAITQMKKLCNRKFLKLNFSDICVKTTNKNLKYKNER